MRGDGREFLLGRSAHAREGKERAFRIKSSERKELKEMRENGQRVEWIDKAASINNRRIEEGNYQATGGALKIQQHYEGRDMPNKAQAESVGFLMSLEETPLIGTGIGRISRDSDWVDVTHTDGREFSFILDDAGRAFRSIALARQANSE